MTAVSADEAKTSPLLTALSATTISGSVGSSATTREVTSSYLAPAGSEFSILGNQTGDQVHPNVILTSNGGLVTWEDNAVDKNGSGIGMRRFAGTTFATTPPTTQVNAISIQNQVNPQAALLATNGLTLFVWQSAAMGNWDIYARLLKTNNLGLTTDLRVNTYLKDAQTAPVIAALNDGSAVIVWQSAWQDGCPSGIFARKISAKGLLSPLHEFEVNQFNDASVSTRGDRGGRRAPAVAVLANGNFIVTWVSEQQNYNVLDSVDIYGRIFAPNLTPVTDEFQMSSSTVNLCANPAIVALGDGGFMAAWSERDLIVKTNSWEIKGRAFNQDGTARGDEYLINSFRFGDQYHPALAACPSGVMAVWTSLGQDGNREGVFGRFVANGSQPSGDEFLVNTTRVSQQMQPTVAWNGVDRFLVVWTSFIARFGFDLYGQVYTLNAAQ
ncbi:MAG: hypothetical protein ACXWBP_01275 [Limisphaerales bacterium]